MKMNDMILQMTYAASQTIQPQMSQSASKPEQTEEKSGFHSLLEEKKTEADRQEDKNPQGVSAQENPSAAESTAAMTSGQWLTSQAQLAAGMQTFQTADAVMEGMTPLASVQGEAMPAAPAISQVLQTAETMASVADPAAAAQPQDGMLETQPMTDKVSQLVQAPEEQNPQIQQGQGARSQGNGSAMAEEKDDSFHGHLTDVQVSASRAGQTEQPLFEGVDSMPQRVGDVPLDTQAEDFDNRLSGKISQALDSGAQRLELKLSPGHLGEVTVELLQDGEGALHVVLHTDNNQAAKLLSEHSGTLGMMLQNGRQGEVHVEVHHQNTDGQPWQLRQEEGHSGQEQQQQQQQHRRSQERTDEFLHQLRLGLVPLEV